MGKIKLQPDEYSISTDKNKLDLVAIHEYLSQRSYWAMRRPMECVERSIQHSLCFGVYADNGKQVGFARVVTDYSTFAWLCDVFILDDFRRRGLGKRLIDAIIAHPDLRDVPRIVLRTRDAHELYRRYAGFTGISNIERWMERLVAPSVKLSEST